MATYDSIGGSEYIVGAKITSTLGGKLVSRDDFLKGAIAQEHTVDTTDETLTVHSFYDMPNWWLLGGF